MKKIKWANIDEFLKESIVMGILFCILYFMVDMNFDRKICYNGRIYRVIWQDNKIVFLQDISCRMKTVIKGELKA